MDTFKEFIDIFRRCVAERNGVDLTNILKDGVKYFQNIPTDKTGTIFSELFDERKGLLCFLNDELSRSASQKSFDTAITETFHLIKFVLVQFHVFLEQKHVMEIKDACQLALVIQCSHLIKKAAADTFNKLLELIPNLPSLGETVKDFIKSFHKISLKERSLVFSVLSTIAKYHAEVPETQKYSENIFKILQNDFRSQFQAQTKVMAKNRGPLTELKIYLGAYKDLLEKFEPSMGTRDKHYKELYEWIKFLSPADKYLRAKDTMREAIDLLSKHMHLFGEFVYRDYKFWYHLLSNLSMDESVVNAECGQRALKVFYKTIRNVLQNKDSEDDKEIFLYFKTMFIQQLTEKELEGNALRLIIYGFSQMATLCKKYSTDSDIKDMYSLIARCTIPLCFREDSGQAHFVNLCDYQEAFSEIISHMSNISIDQMNALIKLSTHIIKRFPELSTTSQTNAIYSLVKTITNVSSVGQSVFDEFLYNIIHDGVSWSCSHTLSIDAEIQQETERLKEKPVSYKDYLRLWVELVKPDRYYRKSYIAQHIFDELIEVFITLINKLNLNIKMKEDEKFSDIALSMIPMKDDDFRIFINLMDLYIDIIDASEAFLLEHKGLTFLYEIIKASYKNPLISRFYKVSHAILKSMGNTSHFENDHDTETFNLISKYLSNTLDVVRSFSDELQTVCLYLILDAPIPHIRDILIRTIPIFKIAFTIGLTEFDLAYTALNTLEKWTSEIESQEMKQFLYEVVPCLEPYLQSEESTAELLQDILKTERKVIKHVTLMDSEKTLESFQRRILLFLGSLESDIVLDFVHKRGLQTGASWDNKDLLRYTLPFPDGKIDILFDKMLPRLIYLALHSGDRRTKVNACEMFHAVILFILGNTSQLLQTDPERFAVMYKKLCPALLNLGCDSDDTVRQLFQPLVLQLTHWLSSKFMLESSATVYLIEAIFDALCNSSNSTLREFAGMCLAEFTDWSIKQCTDRDLEKTHVNIHAVIRKFTYFALHPSKSKRVAAAVGFNHLYKILRERDEIVSQYWLELLYCFVKSLDGCDDPSISNALSHIDRVATAKRDLLNTVYQRRKKPPEFEDATLTAAVHWLLTQCGSLDQNCRKKSMKLFCRFSRCLPNQDWGSGKSEKSTIQTIIENDGIERINSVILKDIQAKTGSVTGKNLSIFLRTLDCYIWLIKEKLIEPKYLFTSVNPKKDVIFDCITNFIHLLTDIKMEVDEIEITKESEELQVSRCKAVMAILEFTEILLTLNDPDISVLLLHKKLLKLISVCVMIPQAIGFDAKNLEKTEELPMRLINILHVLTGKADETLLLDLEMELMNYVEKYISDLFDTERMMDQMSHTELKQYIKGLSILENCNIFSRLCKGSIDFESKITDIFMSMVKKEGDQFVCNDFTSKTMEYLRGLMELLLTTYKEAIVKELVILISNDATVTGTDFIKMTHGEYFLNAFKGTIFRYMLKNVETTVMILINVLQGNGSVLLSVTEKLLLFVQRHKKELQYSTETLANEITKKFSVFEGAVNNFSERTEQLVNIYGIVVRLKRKPTDIQNISEDFYAWILRKLTENSEIEQKTRILHNFLICLVDMVTNKQEIVIILRNLRDNRLVVCPSVPETVNNMDALKAMNCFQTLLMLLPVTKSIAVFECIVYYAAGVADYLCNEKTTDYLQAYFNSISSEYVVNSLTVAYKAFLNIDSRTNDRFDVLQRFLLPAFQYCSPNDIEKFFKKNIKDIYEIMTQSLTGNNADIRRLIISKIGCYDLAAIMFAKVNTHTLQDPEEPITKNAFINAAEDANLVDAIYENAIQVRELKSASPEHKEIMRLLQCSAYNCCISIVSLKEEEEAYACLFREDKEGNRLIWENIIDLEKQYNFRQTLKEYPKNRKKLVNIRKTMKSSRNADGMARSYIHSYNLTFSTLNDDINAYDFNGAALLAKPDHADKAESMLLTFECDDLNNHECMPMICGVLIYMIKQEISVPPDEGDVTMPEWIEYFHSSMSTNHANVRLFLLKVILNVQNVFKPYAKFFLRPVINATYTYLKDHDINYIIADAVVMLIEWRTVAVPSEGEDKKCAQQLVEMMIQKIMVNRTSNMYKGIYKYNVNTIVMLIEAWQTCLVVPKNLDDKMKSAPSAAVHLIFICLVNGMQKQIAEKEGILEFLEKSLEDWKENEEAALQSTESIGLILKFLEEDEKFEELRVTTFERIKKTFRQMQVGAPNKLIRCIRALCKGYPDAAIDFFEFVTASVAKADASGKAHSLEIFLLRIPKLSQEEVIKELGYLKFSSYLKNKVLTCEEVSLKIIRALVTVLPAANLVPLVNLVPPYSRHNLSEYREISFNIFMDVHKRYFKDDSNDENVMELIRLANQILLTGLLDPNEPLQAKLLNFWTEDTKLKETSKDRLLEILKMYSPNSEDVFLPLLPLAMFDLASKTADYDTPLFGALHTDYRDYKIATSWRRKNLRSMTPLFVPSLASEMNQSYTQVDTTLHDSTYNYSSNEELEIRATQDLQFEPTVPENEDVVPVVTDDEPQYDGVFKVPKIPDPAYNKRSKRFLSSSTSVTAAMRQKELKRNLQRTEMIKEEVTRQRSTVKLYRKYRIGDFPDTEITHSDIIVPLQKLIKMDQVVCKDLTVSLFCALVEKVKAEEKSDDFFTSIVQTLDYVLRNRQGNSPIIAATLEIMLHFRVPNYHPDTVVRVAKSNDLNSLGILLLEENLMYGENDAEPPTKRIRDENEITSSANQWIQLASLYESINETDVVLSIFRGEVCSKDMQEASFARAANDWQTAKDAYKRAFEKETSVAKEHSLQGLFECLSYMSRWNDINENIEETLAGDYNNIWKDEWKHWMFPWLLDTYTQKVCLSNLGESFNHFKAALQAWLNDRTKLNYMERLFGEELAIFMLSVNREKARTFLTNALDEIREQWIRINPLSIQLRATRLRKLRGINDINVYLNSMKASNEDGLEDLLKFWKKSEPLVQDELLSWDKVMSYRQYFLTLITEKMRLMKGTPMETQDEEDEEEETLRNLRLSSGELHLQIIDVALHQKNKYIAKKHVFQVEKELPMYPSHMEHRFVLSAARMKYISGESEKNIQKKISNYASSLKYCCQLLKKPDLSTATNVAVRRHLSTVATTLGMHSSESTEFTEKLLQNEVIWGQIQAEPSDVERARSVLESYSFRNLKECCDIASPQDLGECYFVLSKYCYERLVDSANDISLSKEFVSSTLKAMSYGSVKAEHYFPCLLRSEYLEDEETRQNFMKISENVSTWLFLSWQSQLFSHLGTSIAPVVLPIIERIVDTYPNAIIYTFRLTMETNPSLLNDTATYKIRKALYDRPEVERFLTAMQYVVQPEFYLAHHLVELLKNLSQGQATAVDILMKKVFSPATNADDPKPGIIYREILKFQKNVKDITSKKGDKIMQYVLELRKNILKSLAARKDRLRLKDYSPWLDEYAGGDLEVPGQYTGDRKPLPQYHAKIMKIEPMVKIMRSLRKPIRITMVGNDAKNYDFLVKFGEDLRLDQRLQQLFTMMNKILNNDIACRQRRLSIDTYQVVPLSRTLGLIQWVNHTRPLQSLINFTLSKEDTRRHESVPKIYANWIRNAAPRKGESEQYKEALLKYDCHKVVGKMNELIAQTDRNALRNTFLKLAPSPESFVSLRQNFITSYSTLCVAHWILGIGDRHLGNTLVVVESGRSLGIDFGLAFDAGIDQSIPELVPFRLTPQILGLLRPFSEKDLFRATMVHVLRALKNEQNLIIPCMSVFVNEPLNWTEHIVKVLREEEDEEERADVKWRPKKKINMVIKKLRGVKPSLATIEQLKENHYNDKYFGQYVNIVNGNNEEKRMRATTKDDHLSCEEQVDCLLDQATDLNVLGRTYVGWQPWL